MGDVSSHRLLRAVLTGAVSAARLLIICRMSGVAVPATIKSRWGQDHRDEMKPLRIDSGQRSVYSPAGTGTDRPY